MSTQTLAPDVLDELLQIDPAAADLLFRGARTAHAFTDEPVTDAQVQAAYDLVRWGPTALNTLPLRLLLVRTPEARERLGRHMSDGNRAKTLTAPLTIVAATDTNFHEHIPFLAPHAASVRDNLEAAGVEGRAPMGRTSALIQIGYLIVGLRAAGLHVGPMTGFDAAGIDGELFAENGWRTEVVLNVGHPADEGAFRPRGARLDFDQVSAVV